MGAVRGGKRQRERNERVKTDARGYDGPHVQRNIIWYGWSPPSCTPAPATQPNRIRRQLHNDTLLTITNNFISHRLMGLGSGHSTSLRKSVINHVPCILISLIYFIILYLISLFITYIYIYFDIIFILLSFLYLFICI